MAEVNVIYQKIIMEFLFELYVFYALTTRRLNRAPRFWIRVLLWGYGSGTDRHLHRPVCRYRGPYAAVL